MNTPDFMLRRQKHAVQQVAIESAIAELRASFQRLLARPRSRRRSFVVGGPIFLLLYAMIAGSVFLMKATLAATIGLAYAAALAVLVLLFLWVVSAQALLDWRCKRAAKP